MELLLPDPSDQASRQAKDHRAQLLRRVAEGNLELVANAAPRPEIVGYQLESILGEGGAGSVWRARRVADGSVVAIKILHKGQRPPLREQRASARADHPGIVRVHELGWTEQGRPFLVMDLIEGVDLAHLLAREGPLAWPRARALLLQLCDALASAHARGVVHRDLKPTNIVVSAAQADQPERCVIVDLGLSHLFEDSLVSTIEGVLGTPAYISPEQIRGGAIDGRADIYALGGIAYEMISGRRPFSGLTPGELVLQHLGAEVPPLESKEPRTRRRAIDAVIRRALAKLPEQRFANVEQFASALQAVSGHDDERLDSSQRRALALGFVGTLMLAGLGLAGFEHDRASPTRRAGLTPAHQPEIPARASEIPPRASEPQIVSVRVGMSHTCALDDRGRVQCWGANSYGRLGRGSEGEPIGDNEYPALVPPLLDRQMLQVERVETSANARHSCVLDSAHRLRCWGRGLHGGLGLGSISDYGDDVGERIEALAPLPFDHVVDFTLSHDRTCAINLEATGQAEARRLYCWGRGDFGALGRGSVEHVGDDETLVGLTPIELGADVLQVAAGNDHTCALLASDELRCWGSDAHGQLGVLDWSANIGDGVGDGVRGARPDDPGLAVHGLRGSEIALLDAAGNRSCVLTHAGAVHCWGSNEASALGYRWDELPGCMAEDGPDACDLDAPLPFGVDLGDLEGATIVGLSTGQRHTCVLDDRGALRCWGQGEWGQLGTGLEQDVGHWQSPGEIWALRGEGGIVDVGDRDHDGLVDPVAEVSAGMVHTCALIRAGGVRCWGRGADGRLGYASSEELGMSTSPGDHYELSQVYDVPLFAPP